jgi:hypothetical protein
MHEHTHTWGLASASNSSSACSSSTAPTCQKRNRQKFLNVNALVYLLNKVTIPRTFQNLCRRLLSPPPLPAPATVPPHQHGISWRPTTPHLTALPTNATICHPVAARGLLSRRFKACCQC